MHHFFTALEQAARSDYVHFYEPGQPRTIAPSFVNLRGACRALRFRACLRLSQNRPAEAVRDIDTLLRFATLLGDGSNTLVTYMISVAIRGIGLTAATQYYLHFRENPEALALLQGVMDRAAPGIRRDFDIDLLRRCEPGLWPISPFLNSPHRDCSRFGSGYYSRWIAFDHLALCLALERYRKDKGTYPERLEALAPQYLERLPREPFEGRPYKYQREGELFTLQYTPHPDGKGRMGRTAIAWRFPDPQQDGAVRKKLEQIKAKTRLKGVNPQVAAR